MNYFAEIDGNGIVVRVLAVDESDCLDENGKHDESVGISFLQNLLDDKKAVIKQTSDSGDIRKNFAGIGYSWSNEKEAFIPPAPLKPISNYIKTDGEFVLNEVTCKWGFTGEFKETIIK